MPAGRPRKLEGRKIYKNISVDDDLVGMLGKVATELEPEFGFRPTISQTIRYLIKKAANATTLHD